MAMYQFHHVHITSADPSKVIEFYTEVLGAKVTKETEKAGRKMTDLDLDGLFIRVSNSTGADDNWTGSLFGLHHLGLTVANMDKATAEMKSRGVEFVLNPTKNRPGGDVAFFKGPDGVLIEIAERK